MRKFYQTWPSQEIFQTASEKLGRQDQSPILPRFPLSWSHYGRLLSVEKPSAGTFYEMVIQAMTVTVEVLRVVSPEAKKPATRTGGFFGA